MIGYRAIMRERLLNPVKSIGVDMLNLPIKNVDGQDYRVHFMTYKKVDDGSCQCFKDCNCSENRGKITITEITWYRNVKFDNTDKCFYSEPYTQKDYNY